MRQVLATELRDVARSVWTSLGLEAEDADERPASTAPQLVACVHISGGWSGGVEIACPVTLARRAAAAMTGTDTVGDDELNDAFGELANMIGGGVKSAIDGSLALSLPMVVLGREFSVSIPKASPRQRAHLRCGDEVLTVTLFAQED